MGRMFFKVTFLLWLPICFLSGCQSGSSCSVVPTKHGSSVVCTDGTSTNLENGRDGERGEDGQDAIIEVINPCDPQMKHDEVIFRLADGRLFGYFENKGRRYLTLLVPGQYETTDGTTCRFTVEEDGRVTWN